jgi:hypothetical protein
MRPTLVLRFTTAALALGFYSGIPTLVAKADDAENIESIAQVFAANRDQLEKFSCQFQVVNGVADAPASAWREDIAIRRVEEGVFAVNAGDLRYELECVIGQPTNDQIKKLSKEPGNERAVAVACLSSAQLYSKGKHLWVTYSPHLSSINLVPNSPVEAVNTPLSMGIMGAGDKYSPLAFIRGAQAGNYHCRYLGTEVLDGVTVDVLETGLTNSKEPQHKFVWYLDLHRGGIPLLQKWLREDGSLYAETRCIDVRRLSNGGFISGKSVSVYFESDGRCSVNIIKLLSVDLTEPSREMLSLDLPAGTEVVNTADMRSQIKLTAGERLYVDELDQWLKRCDEQLHKTIEEQKGLGVEFQSSAHPTRRHWWWMGGVGIAVAIVCVAVVIRRHYRPMQYSDFRPRR